ncbi:MAG TPA: aminotransferase class V-fold PLP-dependent enzyme, partial [Myxococcota bacterium]|nr:aminotransferase class V-fold PLP-dependent enzyme [Myxococcota bacterium]
AAALGPDVDPARIAFTSGGTEADATALRGAAALARARGWPAAETGIVVTAIEHPAVLETAAALRAEGCRVVVVAVGATGRADPDAVAAACDARTAVVAVMHVNNELGTVQPVADVARAVKARAPRALVHVDAVQSFGWLDCDPARLGCDTLAVSGHKIHAPKGIGALWVRPGLQLPPLLTGGSQEGGLRGGTQNVAGAVALGVAAELAAAARAAGSGARVAALRDRLSERILARVAGTHFTIAGAPGGAGAGIAPRAAAAAARAPHVLPLRVDGVPSEPLLNALEGRGVYASGGAACHAHARRGSHVLEAIGAEPDRKDRAFVRLSLGRETTEEEVDLAADAFVAAVAELRR